MLQKYCEVITSKRQWIICLFSINEIYLGIKGHTDFFRTQSRSGPKLFFTKAGQFARYK